MSKQTPPNRPSRVHRFWTSCQHGSADLKARPRKNSRWCRPQTLVGGFSPRAPLDWWSLEPVCHLLVARFRTGNWMAPTVGLPTAKHLLLLLLLVCNYCPGRNILTPSYGLFSAYYIYHFKHKQFYSVPRLSLKVMLYHHSIFSHKSRTYLKSIYWIRQVTRRVLHSGKW